MNILITGGGTEEAIDNVRSICNFSTGRTSTFLADWLSKKGHTVTALMAERAIKPEVSEKLSVITFKSFQNLSDSLEKLCSQNKWHLIVHAAAVSDFSVASIEMNGKVYKPGDFTKISSDSEPIIRLKRNPKIVDSIKKWCGKDAEKTILVAFKLTSQASEEERKIALDKVFDSSGRGIFSPDYVVSNDLSEITKELHPCTIWGKDNKIAEKTKTLEELAFFLEKMAGKNL
ncbi:MAG: hypothetical protein K6F15_03870 [Treponema sp.]|nr:hypothetical protein [Treponema sp.]